jgi:sn-glycerol 3-phosphate transport system substrate-binding protein
MKWILYIILFVSVSSTLFAKKPTISFWHILGYHAKPIIDEMVEEYNETHPGVVVKADYQGFFEDAQVKLLTSAISKSLPDVAQVPVEFMQTYIDNGIIRPITDEIPEEMQMDIRQEMWSLVEFNGDVYGIPFCVFTDIFYYNENAFFEAGLDPDSPPSSWDEMVAMGERLTYDTDGDGDPDKYALTFYLDGMYGIAPILWSNDGHFFTDDGRLIHLTSPEMKKTIMMVHDLFFKHRIMARTWTGWENAQAFLTGNLAMGWFISAGLPFSEQNLPWPVRIAHMPRMGAGRYALLSGTALVNFSKQKKKRRVAHDFSRWLVEKENDVRFLKESGFVPLRKSSLSSLELKAFIRENPNYSVALEALEYARPLPHHTEFLKINQEISDMLERIILMEADPMHELEQTEMKINSMLQ